MSLCNNLRNKDVIVPTSIWVQQFQLNVRQSVIIFFTEFTPAEFDGQKKSCTGWFSMYYKLNSSNDIQLSNKNISLNQKNQKVAHPLDWTPMKSNNKQFDKKKQDWQSNVKSLI